MGEKCITYEESQILKKANFEERRYVGLNQNIDSEEELLKAIRDNENISTYNLEEGWRTFEYHLPKRIGQRKFN